MAAMRAAALAGRTGARIVLLHVVSPEAGPVDFDGLQRTLAPLLDGIAVQPLLRRGPPAREILAVAREEGADLILMTRHDRWQGASTLGFPRFLLHSVLCRVLLDAPCPVWIEPGAPSLPDIRRFLCGVGSLVHDRDMVSRAAGLAESLGARVALFRCAISTATAVPGRRQWMETMQAEMVASVAADLAGLRGDAPGDICVGIGDFIPTLLREAQAADLIAIRRTSREWGADQTLHPLVRGAAGPVLVYPGERPAIVVARRPPSPFLRRLGPALLLAVLVLSVWFVHHVFQGVRAVDCSTQAYRCAVRENLLNSTRDRLNQTQPRADPRLGPFKDDPPKADANPRP
jgi:nucleotide-binding universal stress UspA family protein